MTVLHDNTHNAVCDVSGSVWLATEQNKLFLSSAVPSLSCILTSISSRMQKLLITGATGHICIQYSYFS